MKKKQNEKTETFRPLEFRQKMSKTSSGDSSDGGEVDAKETTNISPNVENYCKRTFKWVSLLYAEIMEISVSPGEDAQLLKELENILAVLDDEGDVMECFNTIEVKLETADVGKKLKKSSVTTPPHPSKKRRTADVQLPIGKSKGVTHTMRNIAKFVALFEAEATRLNQKNEYGSADVSRIYQLEKDAKLSKDYLLKAREKLEKIINTMKN